MYCIDSGQVEFNPVQATPQQNAATKELAADLNRLHRDLRSRVGRLCTDASQTSSEAQELAARTLCQLIDAVSALPGLADELERSA